MKGDWGRHSRGGGSRYIRGTPLDDVYDSTSGKGDYRGHIARKTRFSGQSKGTTAEVGSGYGKGKRLNLEKTEKAATPRKPGIRRMGLGMGLT